MGCAVHEANSQLTRRGVLGAGMSTMLLGPAVLTPRPARASDPFDAKDPASVLLAVSRMRGSLDGRITMGWLKARRYGVIDAELTPLLGMVTGTFARHKLLENGAIETNSFELAFYTDLETGEVLDTLTMPFTGKTVKVPRLLLGPSRGTTRPRFHEIVETRDAEERTDSEEAMRPPGSTRFERWLGPVERKQDDIWITQASTAVRIPAEPQARKIVYSESVTSRARYDDIASPGVSSVPATLSYTGVSSWRPWMEMGAHPGHTTSHGIGGKTFDVAELPDDYRAMAERFYPEALADPGSLLGP